MRFNGKTWALVFVLSAAIGSLGCSSDSGASRGAGGNSAVGGSTSASTTGGSTSVSNVGGAASGASSGAGGNSAVGGSTSASTTGGSTSVSNVGGAAGNGGNVSSDYQPVSATNSASQYTLQMGSIKMVIDGGKGGRIVEFSFNGVNILTGTDVNASSYGSTFWPSPQSSWYSAKTWPPIPEVDTAAYTGSINDNVIEMTSPIATLGTVANSQFTVTKRFKPVPNSGAVDVTYTIKNIGAVAITVAPWEISRVKGGGGLTFFGKGTSDPTYNNDYDRANFVVVEVDGLYWYKCFALSTAASKCFADGAGWLAHVTATNLLFLLAFPDIQPSQAASGEAEIEFYNKKGDGNYVELEPQGASTTIAAGGTLEWTVRWKLRQVPSGVPVDVGSPELATFTAQQKSQ